MDSKTKKALEIVREVSDWRIQPYAGARYECLFCGRLEGHADDCISKRAFALLTAEPEPCEDEPEPGELIIQGECPCCGNPLKLMVGDDEGEVTVLGLDSKGVVRETFWQETERDAFASQVSDKRAQEMRAQVETLREALTAICECGAGKCSNIFHSTNIEVACEALAATEQKP